ncbi:hypothetical protein DD630_18625 [Streptomyces sp. BSE7F]|nr:hypothetical protein DD630_18625 [Streptomyces sp. BSE7F]
MLAADTEAVHLITEDGRIHAVNRSDGTIRRPVPIGADLGEKARSRALAARRRLVVTAADGAVAASDTADGRQVWQRRSPTGSGRGDVDRSGGTRRVAGSQLAAYDLAHGKELRPTAPGPAQRRPPACWSSPAAGGRPVYATEVVLPARLDLRTGRRDSTSARAAGAPTGSKPCDRLRSAARVRPAASRVPRCRSRRRR